ncbi:CreA protein-domain-containing protein [Pavlovales sp. CCMP2436]|nr:CreA protein-domain-containing protein [Pavlovales sp. CCMP2436]
MALLTALALLATLLAPAAGLLPAPQRFSIAPARSPVERLVFVRSALGLAAGLVVGGTSPEHARAEQIASIPTSGLVFKDTLNIESFDDPKVSGVKLYVADFQRPINERLSSNFFSDPTQASVTCVRIAPMVLADNINTSSEGEEVFSQARSLMFKSVKVRRIYDKASNTLVYVSYSQRLAKDDDANKSRFKSTMCAVPIY